MLFLDFSCFSGSDQYVPIYERYSMTIYTTIRIPFYILPICSIVTKISIKYPKYLLSYFSNQYVRLWRSDLKIITVWNAVKLFIRKFQ